MSVNKDRVRLLVEDLRTTKVPQIKGFLEKDGGNCCLGRACRVAMENGLDVKTNIIPAAIFGGIENVVEFDGNHGALPFSVYTWYGFYSGNPFLFELPGGVDTASGYNDSANLTFLEIADAFEKMYLK